MAEQKSMSVVERVAALMHRIGSAEEKPATVSDLTMREPSDRVCEPGTCRTKVWRVTNNSKKSWETVAVVQTSGRPMATETSTSMLDPTSAEQFLSGVCPGMSVDVRVKLSVPAEGGTYHTTWDFVDSTGLITYVSGLEATIVVDDQLVSLPRLPITALEEIFIQAEWDCRCWCSLVCKEWHAAARSDRLWKPDTVKMLQILHIWVQEKGSTDALLASTLTTLTETLADLKAHLPHLSNMYAVFCLLRRCYTLLAGIRAEEFPVLEQSVRRYCFDLASLWKKPGEVVLDKLALTSWQALFGPNNWAITYKEWVLRMVKNLPTASSIDLKFLQYLKHIVGFPRDKMMTMYRLHLVCSLFGPWDLFIPNFRQIAMSQGFVGIMNMTQAETMLQDRAAEIGTDKVYVLRISRQIPHLFTVTSFNAGVIKHIRVAADGTSNPVPLLEFLHTHRQGFTPAKFSLSEFAVACKNPQDLALIIKDKQYFSDFY